MSRTSATLALLVLLLPPAFVLVPSAEQGIHPAVVSGILRDAVGSPGAARESRALSSTEPEIEPRRPVSRASILPLGEISGYALDEDGLPLRETFLEVLPVAEDEPRVGPVGRSRDVMGWWNPRVLTDDRGHFEFRGLSDGPYRIFLARRAWAGGLRELTLRPQDVGASGLRLQLHGHRMAVRVHDGAGRLFPLVGDYFGPEFDQSVALRCEELPPQGKPKMLFPSEVTHGVAWYDVQPGRTYRVRSQDPANAPQTLRVSPSSWLTSVDLLLPETVSTGSLALTLRDPGGRLYEFDNQVVVRREKDGAVAVRSRMHDGPWFRCGLPPGRYRVRVTAEDTVPACLTGFHPSPADLGPVEASLEVRLGEETELDLHLTRGGRLRLTLDLPQPSPIEALSAALDACRDASNCNASYDALQEKDLGVSIALVPRAGGDPVPLRFFVPGCMIIYDHPQALPGMTTLTETLIPPGSYTLLLEDEDWWASPIGVTIEEGRESAVTLWLQFSGR